MYNCLIFLVNYCRFIINVITNNLNLVDWSTYVVDRGDFKLLQNSIFPDKDGGNVFVEMEAGSIILTEKVTNIICIVEWAY